MRKSLHSPESMKLAAALAQMRADAGLTQRELARKLKTSPSTVAKVEIGERRLDLVEFCWWCQAIGLDPAKTAKTVVERIASR